VIEVSAIIRAMKKLSRRSTLAMPLAAPFLSLPARAAEAPVLVELFTSQGCSSCPPADRLAGVLAKRKDVIVASLNVDYWDYLGWRDTLAKKDYTERQYAYARTRGDGQVYTPQMVINGGAHAVGSQVDQVGQEIDRARRAGARVAVELRHAGSAVEVNLPDGNISGEATLWLLAIAPQVSVKVERGENAGSTITYHNVVTQLSAAGMWKGKATSFALPSKAVMVGKAEFCVAVLQADMSGPVLGLARS
jgi:hypothetical protein